VGYTESVRGADEAPRGEDIAMTTWQITAPAFSRAKAKKSKVPQK